MQQDGVNIHWLTDGPLDQTILIPDNLAIESQNRRGSPSLLLREHEWNRMTVTLHGDLLSLSLNGEQIYQRALEPVNQRHFGFFYYSDQQELRVRNLVWKGNWPRVLPTPGDDELAGEGTDFLDADPGRLSDSYAHDFVNDGMPPEMFQAVDGTFGKEIRVTSAGVVTESTEPITVTFSPHLILFGDFDIVARYDDFQSTVIRGGSGAMLTAVLENTTQDVVQVYRKHFVYSDDHTEHIAQWSHSFKDSAAAHSEHFLCKLIEENAGSLRLARHGDMVYVLTAEGDSGVYCLHGSRKVGEGNLTPCRIRLQCELHGPGGRPHGPGGRTSVTWKQLNVRAQEIKSVPEESPAVILARVNTHRDSLPLMLIHDFTQTSPDGVFLRTEDSP